jgi:xylan 1,4-beta-xylosidase
MQEANGRTHGAFRYVRAHNLYSNGKAPWGEGLDIYQQDAQGRVTYNWATMDEIFDEILRFGLKPIVEFGFTPDALASIPERRQKWGRANISPPKDYHKWQSLVQATVAHLVERYGRNELLTWYFEVWNEPDLGWLFWIEDQDPKRKPYGDVKEYCKLYTYTVAGAKAAFPEIRIGGPVSAGGIIDQFLENILLEENAATGGTGAPVSFISSHAYGNIMPDKKEGRKKADKNITDAIRWKIDRALKHDHKQVQRTMENLPFLLTETGPSARSAFYYNDRYVAAWWTKMVDAMFYIGETWGQVYRPKEIVFWSSQQAVKSFANEKGIAVALETTAGSRVFKRPSFNGFEALGYLSNELVPLRSGAQLGDPVHALATRDGDRSMEILIYHVDESDFESASQDTQDIQVVVENLPFEKFQVRSFLIDETHSNVYTAWKRLGQPKSLSKKDADELDRRDDLEPFEPAYRVESPVRKFEKKFRLQSNSVILFVLASSQH